MRVFLYLLLFGWLFLMWALRYDKGTNPEAGSNFAIALTILIWALYNVFKYRYLFKERRQKQEAIQSEIFQICDQSLHVFESMPLNLMAAESSLDRAESNFSERAFAPFWDKVEQAATEIGNFDSAISGIKHYGKRHKELLKQCTDSAPVFPINKESLKAMKAANSTVQRFGKIVREAQKDFEFATIYEQRRTNKILISGFQNLAQAIDGLGDKIVVAIESLSAEVSTINEKINELKLNIVLLEKISSESGERHANALTMLDNIQHRREPLTHFERRNDY